MSAVKDARRQTARMERVNRTALMNKCKCGNIAGLGHAKCGRCRDAQAAGDAAALLGKSMHYELTREQWAAAGDALVAKSLGAAHHDIIIAAVWDAIWRTAP
jgi:hypothetical protein